ncbi:villin-1-like, partial [Leucoraja erinacea]|uniref:villin-1-like n=1 Tax=Leucoraja erinaceus TaxID=7782 RepID=UPI002453EAB3
YKRGGVASGLKHVETNAYNVQRLLHVKGRKNVHAAESRIKCVQARGAEWPTPAPIVYVSPPPCLQAMQLAKDIRDRERAGRGQIAVVDGHNEEVSGDLMRLMNFLLGERKEIKAAVPDEVVDQQQRQSVKLYRVTDSEGNLLVQEVALRPLTQDLLNSDECHIVDQGGVQIFVWKGKRSTQTERQSALTRAMGFAKAKGYGTHVNIEVENEGSESALFKQLFERWTVPYQTTGLGRTHSLGKIAKVEQRKFDAIEMYARPEMAAQERMVDDGSGEVEVRVTFMSPVPQVQSTALFHILPKQIILRLWSRRGCGVDFFTIRCLGSVAGEELRPPAYLRPTTSRNRDLPLQEEHRDVSPRLFECSNQTGRFVATEVTDFIQDDLDDDDVMLLDTWEQVFLWIGKGANECERTQAAVLAVEYLNTHPSNRDPGTPILIVKQGFEPPTFTGWFMGWDQHLWTDGRYGELQPGLDDPRILEELMNDMKEVKITHTYSEISTSNQSWQTYPIDQLLDKLPGELPPGVDPTRKEEYLSDKDFESIFGTSRYKYNSMPEWKQKNMKKAKGFF